MAQMNIIQAINNALLYEMGRDQSVVLIGEDIGVNGGVFRATDGLLAKYGSDRVIDTPLAEAGIVGCAIGMAVYGLKPVAEVQFEGFLPPAYDQIISHASRMRYRSRGRFTVPMVVRAPYGGGIHAPEHHSDSPEAVYAHIPGLKVVIPSRPSDAKGLLISAIRDPDPVLFLEPKRIYRSFREEVPEGEHTVPLGKARIAREGKSLSLISWGAMVPVALETAERAAQDGLDIEVVDLRTLSPFDGDSILASVKKTKRAVVLHEAPRTGGFGAEVSAFLMEEALLHLESPVQRVTGFDTPMPLPTMEDFYLPNPDRVMLAVEKVMEF
jgi:pyruvate dehydrogenase E1 component beta subunit